MNATPATGSSRHAPWLVGSTVTVYVASMPVQVWHSLSEQRVVINVPAVSWLHSHFAQYCWPDSVPLCSTQDERLSSIFLIVCVVVAVVALLPEAHCVLAVYV